VSHDASRRARKRVQVHVRRSIRVGFQAAVDPSRFGRAKVCANGRLGRNRIAGLQREEDVLGLPHGGGSGLRIFRMAAHGGRDRGVAAVVRRKQFRPHRSLRNVLNIKYFHCLVAKDASWAFGRNLDHLLCKEQQS